MSEGVLEKFDLEGALAALKRDYSALAPRIRTVDHTISCDASGVSIRLHFPAFRQGKVTIFELVERIVYFLTPFSLPRSQLDDAYKKSEGLNPDDVRVLFEVLSDEAKSLFKKANKTTNRNGEAGELLLYLLTEWVLEAPQLIAKMSLKTNSEMPVHGSDGVHVRYSKETDKLLLYWGESKIYKSVLDAINEAISSIATALSPEQIKHEFGLVKRNIDFTGLDQETKKEILLYLDPCEENYNKRHDVITCLIGFSFDAYDQIVVADGDDAEPKFADLAIAELNKLIPSLSKKIKEANIEGHPIELFFFPVPCVQNFRDQFQSKIGWKE